MSYRFANGACLACLCAGPVFVGTLLFATVLETPAMPVAIDLHWNEALVVAFGTLLPVVVVGALLAAVPVLLGGSLLARVGAVNVGLRHPACWAIAGGAMAASPIVALSEEGIQQSNLAIVATGAICALLVRYGTCWSDDSV